MRFGVIAWLLLLMPSARADVARHVLIVANNLDPDHRLPALRFADDDGARYAELFSASGARVELLTTLDDESQRMFPGLAGRTRPPTRERLEAAFAHVFDNIARDRREGLQTELVFIFTGHGRVEDGQGRLLLADGTIDRQELFDGFIAASPAHFNHIVIDACHAYYMVRSRGEWRDDRGGMSEQDSLEAFLRSPDVLSKYPTTGVIVSTSGVAEVHEWDRIRSGVFSHELRSGLLGPADVNGDQRVTYAEIEAFLAAANLGVTNPKARIQVFVHAPRQDGSHPLVDLSEGAYSHFLTIPAGVSGRFAVEDARGLPYADWNKAPDHASRLALLYPPVSKEPGYFVRRGTEEMTIHLRPPRKEAVEIAFDEKALGAARLQERGSVSEAYRRQLFSVPYGAAFASGFDARRRADQVAALERRANTAASPAHLLDAGYGVADALLDADGLSHGFEVGYRWLGWSNFHLSAWLKYLRTDAGQEANAHSLDDLALMVGAGIRHLSAGRVQLDLDLGVGNHWLLYHHTKTGSSPDKSSNDYFAPALALRGGVAILIVDPVWLHARAGLSVVFGAPEGSEEVFFVPEGTFGIGLLF